MGVCMWDLLLQGGIDLNLDPVRPWVNLRAQAENSFYNHLWSCESCCGQIGCEAALYLVHRVCVAAATLTQWEILGDGGLRFVEPIRRGGREPPHKLGEADSPTCWTHLLSDGV